jgi:hypothetical protein
MVNLEEPVHTVMIKLTAQLEQTYSGYVRGLVIQDLRDRGLLPDKLLAELYEGGNIRN